MVLLGNIGSVLGMSISWCVSTSCLHWVPSSVSVGIWAYVGLPQLLLGQCMAIWAGLIVYQDQMIIVISISEGYVFFSI